MNLGRSISITSAALAVGMALSIAAASAQDPRVRSASQFDIGIFAGGAYMTDWFAGAEGGGAFGTSHFAEVSPFDVDFSGFAGGVYVGGRTLISPNVFVGGRLGVLFTSIDGRHEPFPDFRVTIEPGPIVYGDVEIGTIFRGGPASPPVAFSAFVGPAWTSMEVGARFFDSFAFSDRQDAFGLTAGVRVEVPVAQNVAVTGALRYVNFFTQDVTFPGGINVAVETDSLILTAGVRYTFWSNALSAGRGTR